MLYEDYAMNTAREDNLFLASLGIESTSSGINLRIEQLEMILQDTRISYTEKRNELAAYVVAANDNLALKNIVYERLMPWFDTIEKSTTLSTSEHTSLDSMQQEAQQLIAKGVKPIEVIRFPLNEPFKEYGFVERSKELNSHLSSINC